MNFCRVIYPKKHMQSVIDQSVSSFMARVSENIHSLAQWAKS